MVLVGVKNVIVVFKDLFGGFSDKIRMVGFVK